MRGSHLINFVFIGMPLRSGIEIPSSLPRLWWRSASMPGIEWINFTKRELPKEEGVYTSLMDELSVSPMLSLPGRGGTREDSALQELYDIFASGGLGQATFEITDHEYARLVVKHKDDVIPSVPAMNEALAKAGNYEIVQ